MAKGIVVGVDGSEPSREALEWAADEARLRGVPLTVVHAWSSPWEAWGEVESPPPIGEDESARREELLEPEIEFLRRSHADVAVEPVVTNDLDAHALIEASDDADLIVVGSRGRGGFAGLLLGSVGQQVVHHARCPVVVIPHDR